MDAMAKKGRPATISFDEIFSNAKKKLEPPSMIPFDEPSDVSYPPAPQLPPWCLRCSSKLDYVWEPPRPLQEWGDDEYHRHESWFELFFDLLFVPVAVKLGEVLKCSLYPEALVKVYFVFSAFNHNWSGYTLYVNTFEKLHLVWVAAFFIMCLCIVVMASDLAVVHAAHGCEFDTVSDHFSTIIDAHCVFQMVFVLIHLQVAFFCPQFRKSSCLVSLAWFLEMVCWLTSRFISGQARFVCWVLGRLAFSLIWTVSFKFNNPPVHIAHFSQRMGVFVMIFVGEAIIQIILADPPEDISIPSYRITICIAFGITFFVALNYFHCQPHSPKGHVLSLSSQGSFVWLKLHSFLRFAIFGFGVGVKAILHAQPITANHEYYWLLCLSVTLSYFLGNWIRILHHGQDNHTVKKCAYYNMISFRFVIVCLIAVMPVIISSVTTETQDTYKLLLPVLLLASVNGFADLIQRPPSHDDGEVDADPQQFLSPAESTGTESVMLSEPGVIADEGHVSESIEVPKHSARNCHGPSRRITFTKKKNKKTNLITATLVIERRRTQFAW